MKLQLLSRFYNFLESSISSTMGWVSPESVFTDILRVVLFSIKNLCKFCLFYVFLLHWLKDRANFSAKLITNILLLWEVLTKNFIYFAALLWSQLPFTMFLTKILQFFSTHNNWPMSYLSKTSNKLYQCITLVHSNK